MYKNLDEWVHREGTITNNLFFKKLREGGLSDDQMLVVVNALVSTCNSCWMKEPRCQCDNDE